MMPYYASNVVFEWWQVPMLLNLVLCEILLFSALIFDAAHDYGKSFLHDLPGWMVIMAGLGLLWATGGGYVAFAFQVIIIPNMITAVGGSVVTAVISAGFSIFSFYAFWHLFVFKRLRV